MVDNNFWDYLKEGFLNLIYPLSCQNCGRPIKESKGYSLCDDCLKLIKLISPPYCYRCGKPFSGEVDFEEKAICADCLTKKRPYYFTRSVAYYQGVLREGVHLLKYQKQVKLVQPLGNLLVSYLAKNDFIMIREIDLVVPVPLFKKDCLKRGFNQSSLLAKYVADYFSLYFSEDLLIKDKMNLSQVGLSKTERKKNVRKVYTLNTSFSLEGLSNILLIDDIFTTGATIDACCRELKKTGVEKLYVLTLARGV
ncbi:MAG: ComF family protein [Candidatus Atribacteria bacterium]|nr:ComF family protein [Candidatus Atribacteria bacterium]